MIKKYRIVVVGVYLDSFFAVREEFIVKAISRNLAKKLALGGYSDVWSISCEFLILETAKIYLDNILTKIKDLLK